MNEFSGKPVAKSSLRSMSPYIADIVVKDEENGEPWQDIHDHSLRALLSAPAGQGKNGWSFQATALARQRIHSRNRYTLRDDRTVPRAEITLQTAAALRERFPATSRFANRLFAKGLAGLPRSVREDPKRNTLLNSYLELTTLPERLAISMRLLRYRAQRSLGVRS